MYNTKNSSFNTLLTQYRKSRGLTLENLGNKIGKTKATISKYERGEIIPDIVTALEICNVLDITLSQLFPMESASKKYNSRNPFDVDKLYLYYYTENILITSIIELREDNNEIQVKLYNGVKNIKTYASETSYYYDGIMVCDKTIGYINLQNTASQKTQLEKLQISFAIPWSNNIEITNFFILGLTPNSVPTVKKGIMSIKPIDHFEIFENDLKLNKDDITTIQKNNAWILENKNYSHFFLDKK